MTLFLPEIALKFEMISTDLEISIFSLICVIEECESTSGKNGCKTSKFVQNKFFIVDIHTKDTQLVKIEKNHDLTFQNKAIWEGRCDERQGKNQ